MLIFVLFILFRYTALGHKLRFFRKWKAQFVTVGIIYANHNADSKMNQNCPAIQGSFDDFTKIIYLMVYQC